MATAKKPTSNATLEPLTEKPIFRRLFWILIAVLGLLMPILSTTTGINADDRWQIAKSKAIVAYYYTMGEDTSIYRTYEESLALMAQYGEVKGKEMGFDKWVPDPEKLRYYGGFFELTTGVINDLIGNKDEFSWSYINVRHIFNALLGVLCIMFAGLLAFQLTGAWRAAVFTALLLAFSPNFFGHSLMNPKDIPFAFGYLMTVYFLVRFIKGMPEVNWKVVAGLVAAIAITLNIRAGGLLLIIYTLFFSGAYYFFHAFIKKDPRFDMKKLVKVSGTLALISVAGYFLGVIFWPFGLSNPLTAPFDALTLLTNYEVNIVQLFDGGQIMSTELPWYYLPKYIVITNPYFLHFGLLLFAVLVWKYLKQLDWQLLAFLLFVTLFPVFYILYKNSNVYNGWRHVLFIYPLLIVFAASGWELLLRTLKATWAPYVVGGAMGILMLLPAIWMVGNHPYYYAYFNELAGGTGSAWKNYETDYWMLGVREASLELYEKEKLAQSPKKIVIGTNCFFPAQTYFGILDKENIEVRYIRYYEKWQKPWDYGIFYNGYINPYELQNDLFPPSSTIITTKAGGAPLCAVLKRQDTFDLAAYEAMGKQAFAQAAPLFVKALQTRNREADLYRDLGFCYLNLGDLPNAINSLNNSVSLNPDDFGSNYYIGVAYAQGNKPNLTMAANYLNKALTINPGASQARQLLDQINKANQGGFR
jgi:tetratricopeptide (TPR) repeat protein